MARGANTYRLCRGSKYHNDYDDDHDVAPGHDHDGTFPGYDHDVAPGHDHDGTFPGHDHDGTFPGHDHDGTSPGHLQNGFVQFALPAARGWPIVY